MHLRPCLAFLLLSVALALPSANALAQSTAQENRVAASFVLAYGRLPGAAELESWTKLEPLSMGDLLSRHRRQIQSDPAAQEGVAARAALDAFGRAPGQQGPDTRPGGGTYVESMRRNLRWLAENPAEYQAVLHRAYRLLLGRDAFSIEIDYWKRQPTLSFALLVACIEDWARRNQPGLMATTGVASASVNSRYLATVRLSPAVAAEARAAVRALIPGEDRAATGFARNEDAALASAVGRHVVAPGADQVVSLGGIHFAAAGSDALVGGQ